MSAGQEHHPDAESLGALPSETELTAAAARVFGNALEDVRMEIRATEAELGRQMRSLARTLELEAARVEEGQAINEIGVVQAQGPNIDRLCGRRARLYLERRRLEWMTERLDVTPKAEP